MTNTETKTNQYLKALLAVLAALTLAAGLVAALAKPAEAAFPGKNGKIVFSSNRHVGVDNSEKDYELFTVNKDGSGLKQLTKNALNDYEPAFSPDGKRIAFNSTRYNNSLTVYTMKANGENQIGAVIKAENPDWGPKPG